MTEDSSGRYDLLGEVAAPDRSVLGRGGWQRPGVDVAYGEEVVWGEK